MALREINVKDNSIKIPIDRSGNYNIYSQDIASLSQPITAEQEAEYIRLYQETRDLKYRDKVLCANLRFVIRVAQKYQNNGISIDDLISEGNYGLMVAFDKFDLSRGFKFISYAVWYIRHYIMLALEKNARTIRIPSHIYRKRENQEEWPVTISLDKPFNIDLDHTFLDAVENKNASMPDEAFNKINIEPLLNILKPREQRILILYYGLGERRPLNIKEITEYLKVYFDDEMTHQNVSKILINARWKLARKFGDNYKNIKEKLFL